MHAEGQNKRREFFCMQREALSIYGQSALLSISGSLAIKVLITYRAGDSWKPAEGPY